MKNLLKDNHGFTLVEMLLVMLVITVLLLIMIPNVTKNSTLIGDKGCEALLRWNNYNSPSLKYLFYKGF